VTKILAIALNTFRESSRSRIPYTLLFFALLLLVSSAVLGELSIGEEIRVIQDVGLFGISFFGVIIAIVTGVTIVHTEIDKKTIYTILARPLHRYQFIVGKFLGLGALLAIQVAIMATVLGIILVSAGGSIDANLLKAIVLALIEILVVTAVAILFSSFSTPVVSGLLTLGVFAVGRLAEDIQLVTAKVQSDSVDFALNALVQILPNLNLFAISGKTLDGRHVSVHGFFVPWTYVLTATGYGLLYAAVTLGLSALIFSRREFT
jgi:ABC-type transport system involved in multi-copper enzyme maturation permease subunit